MNAESGKFDQNEKLWDQQKGKWKRMKRDNNNSPESNEYVPSLKYMNDMKSTPINE